MERRYAVDPAMTMRLAECDGGGPVRTDSGQVVSMRFLYRGRLTGVYFEEGEPPWRWYEMTDLSIKPPWHTDDSVWCEQGFLFLIDEPPAEARGGVGFPGEGT